MCVCVCHCKCVCVRVRTYMCMHMGVGTGMYTCLLLYSGYNTTHHNDHWKGILMNTRKIDKSSKEDNYIKQHEDECSKGPPSC